MRLLGRIFLIKVIAEYQIVISIYQDHSSCQRITVGFKQIL